MDDVVQAMTRTLHTLGDASRHGMLLTVRCMRCGHCAHHRTRELAARCGNGKHRDDLKFICSKCGARDFRTIWNLPELI